MNKRLRIHPPYHLILAYMKIRGISTLEMADFLDMGERTFLDKVYGFSDFSLSESNKIKIRLEADDGIFLTSNVMLTSQN